MGLPTPNIFAGEQNFHSRLEWVSVQDMEKAVEVIVELAQGLGGARVTSPVVPGGALLATSPVDQLGQLLGGTAPFLALAPMQEVTDGAFWTLVHQYGGADVYWTEYFRVHATSTPEKRILDSIRKNSTAGPPSRR